jgi:UDP-N-acetylmuramoyl-L-alanyl-D-glutamate--2,6-diaminopimelate ligase
VAAVPQLSQRASLIADRFFGAPSQALTMAGITGTNGKTTCAWLLAQALQFCGRPAAYMGTLGYGRPPAVTATEHTTSDAVSVQRHLAALRGLGAECVCMEVSSHALDQDRVTGVRFNTAAFTNLTRDHLDYHGDMESYRAAKQRLFNELLQPGGSAILNADSPEFAGLAALCRARGHQVIGYGSAAAAELRLVERSAHRNGQRLHLSLFGKRHDIELPLVGEFQAMNVLAAVGLVIATGSPLDAAMATLARLTGVPGRLQRVGESAAGAPVFVDYAHTPDALATVLSALRPHAEGRLAIVFGAGGDRDRGKRPLMGQVAADLADLVYVTDDNPRSEPPEPIRRAIIAAAPHAVAIADRREAIAAAIAELRHGDILVIAGKGHETGQIIGDKVLPFDDALVAREAIAAGGGT